MTLLTPEERRKVGKELTEFLEADSPELRTVIVEARTAPVGVEGLSDFRSKRRGAHAPRKPSATHKPPSNPTSEWGEDTESMIALKLALERLEISTRPIDAARAFVVEATPRLLQRILKLDEVAAVYPNRTHRARAADVR